MFLVFAETDDSFRVILKVVEKAVTFYDYYYIIRALKQKLCFHLRNIRDCKRYDKNFIFMRVLPFEAS